MANNNNNRNYSSFPLGFQSGVLIQNVPVQPTAQSQVFWVGNNAVLEYNEVQASNNNKGTFLAPFATLKYALSQCSAGNENTIYVRAGYTETITTAGGLTFNVPGVKVIGLGQKINAPTFLISGAAASILFTANDISVTGIEVNITSTPTTPMVAQNAEGLTLSVVVNTGGSNPALTMISSAECNIDIRFINFSGTTAVTLNECDDATINIDFRVGTASVAVVQFVTVASQGVVINGIMNNVAVPAASKNIVDTITGSKWFSTISDIAAGNIYIGGSGRAPAPLVP